MRSVCFVDRDGTLLVEPEDEQIDRLDKLKLVPGVLPALLRMQQRGYRFVVVTNQDGLGTASFPRADYDCVHEAFVELFASQGIEFDAVLVCPHRDEDGCTCRKPHLGLLTEYLAAGGLDLQTSCVIGDRESDLGLAHNLGVRGLRLARNGVAAPGAAAGGTWPELVDELLAGPRSGHVTRTTNETSIEVRVRLDGGSGAGTSNISTGIGFLDHMLEQLARHGGFNLELSCRGDLEVDDHHTVEDVGLALGEALSRALGERAGIGRYGFSLPMDESSASALVDLSGRSLTVFEGQFPVERVGALATEMVPHFFRSFAGALQATLHVRVQGDNGHHMVEACFKAVARALRPALALQAGTLGIPSTKGLL